MHLHRSTSLTIIVGLICTLLGACSKEPPPAAATATPASKAASAGEETLEAKLVAAGTPATYRATFAGGQLQRIIETRADAASGEYDFYGARLMKYSGPSSTGSGPIELQFNLQGALTSSQAGSGPVSAEEVSAIRNRAALLRSHALTQRSVRAHQTH